MSRPLFRRPAPGAARVLRAPGLCCRACSGRILLGRNELRPSRRSDRADGGLSRPSTSTPQRERGRPCATSSSQEPDGWTVRSVRRSGSGAPLPTVGVSTLRCSMTHYEKREKRRWGVDREKTNSVHFKLWLEMWQRSMVVFATRSARKEKALRPLWSTLFDCRSKRRRLA